MGKVVRVHPEERARQGFPHGSARGRVIRRRRLAADTGVAVVGKHFVRVTDGMLRGRSLRREPEGHQEVVRQQQMDRDEGDRTQHAPRFGHSRPT